MARWLGIGRHMWGGAGSTEEISLTLEYTPGCMLKNWMGTQPLQIGQVAQKTGLSVDAIQKAQQLGFSLNEIRELFSEPSIRHIGFLVTPVASCQPSLAAAHLFFIAKSCSGPASVSL